MFVCFCVTGLLAEIGVVCFCRHMLTDSLHICYDSRLYLSAAVMLQCRDSSTLQFTGWQSVTELQQHIAGCVPEKQSMQP